jgi:hypothetical protein
VPKRLASIWLKKSNKKKRRNQSAVAKCHDVEVGNFILDATMPMWLWLRKMWLLMRMVT